MKAALLVGIGGCVGALMRYGIHLGMLKLLPASRVPMGTLVANVIGCLLIGVLVQLLEGLDAMRLLLITGVLGSLTTFSTFGHDTVTLVKDHSLLHGLGHAALTFALGLGAVVIGMSVAKLFEKGIA